jgi:hypothetical protein
MEVPELEKNSQDPTWPDTYSPCEMYGHNWYEDEIPHRCAECGYQERL